MADSEVDQQRLVIQRNNEAVIMIQRGEFTEAKKLLMDALREIRSRRNADRLQPGDSTDGSSLESLCLDQWMVSSTEALHTRLSEAATQSFFVYPKGILVPINFFQDNENRYCHVDVTAAISSVICFNQGLACQLAHIRAPAQSRDVKSLQKASALYRLSIQGTRHRQQSMPAEDNSVTNANFLIAAMNNLAVSERIYDISTSTKASSSEEEGPEVNYQYFETLRSFLLNWRPSTSNSPDEILWIHYLENVLRGCDLEQSNYSVIPV
mmetsp:Transcript_23816/g.58296  ORF Transcript_23816/g.58296 Transcript_23816/m.58296 type:complete len:267 (+) Transcript_23816:143-943(+)|eukprot:CAMPEP_0113636036 /NCGR_PEP_ID=MMETSP0017_2-20120614/18804_1 /TAXON_ID=2856 /ORGANISM="Cylindrotheca closterium" /LENGTH=266 /DNA_ID=CAMNT_0000546881 /DNA_START=67 /DNA_END=867 /DNA_ORIENTATION=- /assembly_acc=CAM_ASM_000147